MNPLGIRHAFAALMARYLLAALGTGTLIALLLAALVLLLVAVQGEPPPPAWS